MVRNQYAMPIRKRPRPKMHKFHPYVSHMNDVCHDDHICNACMEAYAAEAEYNRPGHAWRVEDGKIVYVEDEIMAHHLGRPLKPTEGVMHKNGNTLDNRFDNLELVTLPDMEAQ
jgi:hypothetical protein